MPKTINPKTGEVTEFDYTKEGRMKAERHAMETGDEIIPTYDAGGRVEKYHLGGEIDENVVNTGAHATLDDEMMDEEQVGLIKKAARSGLLGLSGLLLEKGGKVKK